MPLHSVDRRRFLQGTSAAAASGLLAVHGLAARAEGQSQRRRRRRRRESSSRRDDEPLYQISLAQWSLHRTFRGQGGETEQDPRDFAQISRELGIEAIEYVNQFFKDKARDTDYLADLKSRADSEGVKSLLIMCDGEGRLGDPNDEQRTQAVENHYKWVEAAKFLDCHSIRVNAGSAGSYEEQQKLAADGLRRLCEFADDHEINVIVENHGGLSSHGEWLAGVMQMVDHDRCGTLPDFGNFAINRQQNEWYDRYQGVRELMPFAKAVSAKSHGFDAEGREVYTDYDRMMRIVLDAGYDGYVGIEYEGPGNPNGLQEPRTPPVATLNERDGILATKRLLEEVRAELA